MSQERVKDLVVVTGENVNFLSINKNVKIQLSAGGGKFERKNVWALLAFLCSDELGFYPKLIEKTRGLCKSNIIIK